MSGPHPIRREDDGDRREHERVRALYDHYDQERYRRLWSGPSIQIMHERKWEFVRRLLAGLGGPERTSPVLDIGAGAGPDCVEFDRLGFPRHAIVAVDLVRKELRAASRTLPGLPAAVGDASRLPFRDGTAGLVFQSTMLSSVPDPDRRGAIYAEFARVLRPGGCFLSYDTRYPNPWNPLTRPVRLAELRRSFPGWRVEARSLTLLPPLLRALAPASRALCRTLESLPPLRSHLIAWAVKP